MTEGKVGFHISTPKSILDKKRLSNGGKLDHRIQSHQLPNQPVENTTSIPGPKELSCPECGSQKLWKDGLRYARGREDPRSIQRFLCRDCGYRFSEKGSWDPSGPLKNGSSWSINSASAIPSKRQVCEILTEDSKNLATVEPLNEGLAGATEQQDTKGKLLQFAIWMNREGYHESTIHHSTYSLDLLHRCGANLLEPDSVKEVLSKLKNSNATKSIMSKDYKLFTKYLGIKWEKPRYTPEQKLPFIPTEREIDDLIAYVKPRIGLALRIAKGTGARIGEIAALEWLDIDFERKFLRINKPEKGSLPRAMQISNDLVDALQAFKNRQKTLGKYIFQLGEGHTPSRSMQATLASAKKRLAFRLNNPRLHEIHFHIIRHWKGTMEYHKTKDIMHVKKILGHKSINSTMIYINLEQAIFTDTPEEFHIKVTDNLEEACKLLEVGFEYVTDMEGKKVFRKRK